MSFCMATGTQAEWPQRKGRNLLNSYLHQKSTSQPGDGLSERRWTIFGVGCPLAAQASSCVVYKLVLLSILEATQKS